MSWLADRTIEYLYERPDGGQIIVKLKASEEAPKVWKDDDGVEARYAGFLPDEVKQTNIVEYEKNGRKAVRIRDKNGNISHLSKTKLHYKKTGRIENQYTREYREHLEKTKQEHMLRTEHNTKRAKVSSAKPADVLKNLPDGEYVSDGTNVMPAPKKGV